MTTALGHNPPVHSPGSVHIPGCTTRDYARIMLRTRDSHNRSMYSPGLTRDSHNSPVERPGRTPEDGRFSYSWRGRRDSHNRAYINTKDFNYLKTKTDISICCYRVRTEMRIRGGRP
jgi:hypothetical protein